MGILFVIFAASMAAATFIENDYGSAAAYNFVYDTRWFELILLLLAVNLSGQVVSYKLFRKEKLTILLFHLSFILILAGAAITRYAGWEGSIHIREGEEQDKCFSGDRYIGHKLMDASGVILDQSSTKYYLSMKSAGNFTRKIRSGETEYRIELARIVVNAAEVVDRSIEGEGAIISFLAADSLARKTYILKEGESAKTGNVSVGFNSPENTDISIFYDSLSFYLTSILPFSSESMMAGESISFSNGDTAAFEAMKIFRIGGISMVPQQMERQGGTRIISADMEARETGQNAFIFSILTGDNPSGEVILWDGNDQNLSSASTVVDGKTIEITYGSQERTLPFSLRLNDFILDRYPGSNSPSGYKSDIVLTDGKAGIEKPFTIFMNNILKYKGYRFYQSSYDQDELGTILSVNHDPAGMFVTYTGYGVLILFLMLSLLNRKSVFNTVKPGLWTSALRKKAAAVMLLAAVGGSVNAWSQKLVPDKAMAEEFGKVLVQDQKGRTEPLFTLSYDILRKVTRENKFRGLAPMQVFLGVYLDFDHWKDEQMIRVSNRDIQKIIGISGQYASFTDLVDLQTGKYKLSEAVGEAYSKSPGERTKADKELIKVDERVNIIYMIYTGGFTRIFPLHDGTMNWGSPEDALKTAISREDSVFISNVIPVLSDAMRSGNASNARQIAGSVKEYQSQFSAYELPPPARIKAESLYYRMMVFERLFPFYLATGILLLAGLIIMVLKGKRSPLMFTRILAWILFAGFLFHTLGLGLRWFISGHSPMSNGYESMIFISWVTLLAGFLFSRRSPFALPATAVLSGLTLMVAHLSFMDPEITNLVPVLQSYWLTLHVSVITASYGFLGLGAILAIITMILLSLSGESSLERISSTIDDLTVINYKSLTIGLYMLTIGTFLGAVWANESWGRYWGWDPKETWSLITIIVYSFVIHSRMIPGMKDIYTFNLLSLFAFSSVLMTYFGVNYYLSGLHSYAGGDPVPVPVFVYVAAAVLVSLALAGRVKYRKWEKKE